MRHGSKFSFARRILKFEGATAALWSVDDTESRTHEKVSVFFMMKLLKCGHIIIQYHI